MLHYILQIIAFQLFFLIIYDVFLKNETFFNWNRIYLLLTAIASVILPFVKLQSMRAIVPQNFVIRLPEVIIGEVTPIPPAIPVEVTSHSINTTNFAWSWDYLLYLGMIVATLVLLFKLIKISRLIQKNPKRWKDDLLVVHLMKSNAAFSFFHYVFIGEYIKDEERDAILAHESVHVQHKHTLDLMLFEVFRIVFWFNPLVYMYQNRMTILHEYIADAKAVKKANKAQYYQNLLSQVFHTQQISFTNTFYQQSLIKKRILMLSKSKSNRINLLKYALLIPLIAGMLLYTSSYAQKTSVDISLQEIEANQELSLSELTQKYYQEIIEFEKSDENEKMIFETYMPKSDKYIFTKVELAKLHAVMQFIYEGVIDKKRKEGSLTEQDNQQYEKRMLKKYKTYEEYLDYQKTDEAKLMWENNTSDGVLRLVVDDFKDLTETEKNKQQEKIDLILKDDYYHGLIVTDGIASSKLEIDKPKNAKEEKEFESYEIEVPFSVIDEVPTFTECKSLETREDIRTCTSDKISEFVNTNFNTNLGKELSLKGRQRINVMFKIGTDGKIHGIKVRGPHPALEVEAKRVIASLPQMIPGQQKGEPVVVPYSLPIIFQIGE